jgi:hypothetical protein
VSTVRRVTEGVARRTVVQRLNDNALEYAVLALRSLGSVAILGWLVAIVALIWTADLRWLATMVVLVIVGSCSTWLGFWTFGNEGWKRDAE